MTLLEVRWWVAGLLTGMASAGPMAGQVETHLGKATEEAYGRYVEATEAQLGGRWNGTRPTMWLEEDAARRARVRAGEFVIERSGPGIRMAVPDGQVHDWTGAMWLPGATVGATLHAIGDADRQKDFHPEMMESRLVSRTGDTSRSHWRVRRTKVITVVLDMDLSSEFLHFPSGLAAVRTHATRVSEVQHPGSAEERVLAQGEGNGFMWHLDAYWTLKQEPDGVLAECRSVSLSRPIPRGLAWIIGPMVESVPRDSLLSTLRGTRLMVESDSVRK